MSVPVHFVARSVAVTVYKVVTGGVATGVDEEALFRNCAGCHVYVSAPVAINCAVGIAQSISFDFEIFNDGGNNILTVVVSVSDMLQVFSVIITV